MLQRLRDLVEDYPRRAAVVVVAVLAALLIVMSQPAGVALADVCGAQPDWWTLDYITWLSCEASNGGAATAVQAVTSPVFDYIDSDLQSINGTLSSDLAPLATMTGSITGAVNNLGALFTPGAADATGLAAQIQGIAQTNSALAYAATLTSEVQSMQAAIDAASSGASSAAVSGGTVLAGDPVTYTDVYGFSHSVALGPLGTGVTWFLYGLDQLGWHPDQFRQFVDAWWAIVAVVAVLRDFGVHFGSMPGAIGDHVAFWQSRSSERASDA